MESNEILHYLRNPYGKTKEECREIMHLAAERIEQWKDAYENMRDYAVSKGLDVTTYYNGKRNGSL